MQPSTKPITGNGATAPAIFTRLSDEMGRCAAIAADLQDLFGSASRESPAGGDIKRAQSLDLLEQTLRDLGAVLTAIHQGKDPVDTAALASVCKLDDVARRLQGLTVVAHSDDVDMF